MRRYNIRCWDALAHRYVPDCAQVLYHPVINRGCRVAEIWLICSEGWAEVNAISEIENTVNTAL